MLTVEIYLDRSPVGGIGVFAKQFIKKGQQVYKHDPRFTIIIGKDEVDTWPEATQKNFYLHAYPGKGEFRMKQALFYNIDESKYMNHSDTPNLIWVPLLGIYVATSDIQPGTELTCDYNEFCERGDTCFNW